ncbi:MAG: CUAEP/CCAEP-tail radical SAM (seleno)protein [Ktedonobacterales bacterium]
MRTNGAILLISCYELGHQPLNLASPLAALQQAGFAPVAVDSSVQPLDDASIGAARLVAISVPMHTALRLGVAIAERAREVNPGAHICFYGLYASLNGDYLLRRQADSVIGGEFEEALVALATALEAGDGTSRRLTVPGVRTIDTPAAPVLKRLSFTPPAREQLPPSRRYAHLVHGGRVIPAGYVEASRGCLHTCRHCPITPVYGGRFFVVPAEVVLQDIRKQVQDGGVRHITFGDPDFLNGPGHSMSIVRRLHEEFPEVSFDATIKVEHILERRNLFPELTDLGCAFVVSAVESLSPVVLSHLKKGHTQSDVVEALSILDQAGIPMRPTLVAFTPWTTPSDYMHVLAFVAANDLVEHIDPIQYSIRLLIPPGSALLEERDQYLEPGSPAWLGALDDEAFTYHWRHPDPRMDSLHREVAALVELAARDKWGNRLTFQEVCALAEVYLGESLPPQRDQASAGARRVRRPVPHLSEPWFC